MLVHIGCHPPVAFEKLLGSAPPRGPEKEGCMYGPLLSGSPLPWSPALEVRNTVNIFLTPSYRTSTEQGLPFKAPGTVVNTS